MLRGLKKKQAILKTIEKNPGTRFSDIHKMTGFGHGVVSHHLSMLEKEGSIRINRDKRNIRVFQSSLDPSNDNIIISIRKETCKKILAFLLDANSANFVQIYSAIKKSPGTTSSTLKKLVELEVLIIIHGFPKKYAIKDEVRTRELFNSLSVSQTDEFKDRFADTFSYL
ncbi:ArsR family transcriptional regulator [Nitrosopumilus sp.]|uniref:winged helix-turn-helix transcriptional regulator n=1 Tax=Nitrosopumilus sp. TaxID=2024843 RepID=UPI0026390C85|nr:ArsR family transcriptional regulator [Nitrosopumilus sp.]